MTLGYSAVRAPAPLGAAGAPLGEKDGNGRADAPARPRWACPVSCLGCAPAYGTSLWCLARAKRSTLALPSVNDGRAGLADACFSLGGASISA